MKQKLLLILSSILMLLVAVPDNIGRLPFLQLFKFFIAAALFLIISSTEEEDKFFSNNLSAFFGIERKPDDGNDQGQDKTKTLEI